jgi:excisionase family DNA binding protein
MQQLLIGVRQAADAIGLSHWTIRQYIREGKILGVRIGKRMLVEPAELQRLVDKGRSQSSGKGHDHAAN